MSAKKLGGADVKEVIEILLFVVEGWRLLKAGLEKKVVKKAEKKAKKDENDALTQRVADLEEWMAQMKRDQESKKEEG